MAGIQDCPHLTDIVYSSSISSSRVLFWLQPGNTNLTLMHMRVRIVRITLRTQAKQHQIKKAIRKTLIYKSMLAITGQNIICVDQ